MATEKILDNLVINYLTQAQFDALETKNADEIYLTPDVEILNTAGSNDTSSKIFLVGTTSQTSGSNALQTYSHDTAYVGTDGCLYSGGDKVLTSHQTYNSFTGKPTSNQTPGFGNTFTIQQISQSTSGQVSGTDRTVTIPSTIATYNGIGLVKPWYSHSVASTGPTAGTNTTAVQVNAISTTSGKYYAIEADKDGRLFVNVPWSVPNATGSTTTGITASTDANKTTVGSHSTDYGVKTAGSGEASFNAKVTSHILSFEFSHTHTAPTLGSKVPTVSTSSASVTINETAHSHTI